MCVGTNRLLTAACYQPLKRIHLAGCYSPNLFYVRICFMLGGFSDRESRPPIYGKRPNRHYRNRLPLSRRCQ
jgi:hypothetical protein